MAYKMLYEKKIYRLIQIAITLATVGGSRLPENTPPVALCRGGRD